MCSNSLLPYGSHAILEAWGQTHKYLLIADVDEYFVLPTPGATLDSVLRTCTDNKTQVRLCCAWNLHLSLTCMHK